MKPPVDRMMLGQARTEVAELRAEVERLTKMVERLTKMLDVCSAVHGHNVKTKARLASARALLARVVKYAIEDRAITPGTTRLTRVIGEADAWLTANPESPRAKPPYAVVADGSIEPLENCPECGAMGKARFAHLHICESPRAAAERAVQTSAESPHTAQPFGKWLEDMERAVSK